MMKLQARHLVLTQCTLEYERFIFLVLGSYDGGYYDDLALDPTFDVLSNMRKKKFNELM